MFHLRNSLALGISLLMHHYICTHDAPLPTPISIASSSSESRATFRADDLGNYFAQHVQPHASLQPALQPATLAESIGTQPQSSLSESPLQAESEISSILKSMQNIREKRERTGASLDRFFELLQAETERQAAGVFELKSLGNTILQNQISLDRALEKFQKTALRLLPFLETREASLKCLNEQVALARRHEEEKAQLMHKMKLLMLAPAAPLTPSPFSSAPGSPAIDIETTPEEDSEFSDKISESDREDSISAYPHSSPGQRTPSPGLTPITSDADKEGAPSTGTNMPQHGTPLSDWNTILHSFSNLSAQEALASIAAHISNVQKYPPTETQQHLLNLLHLSGTCKSIELFKQRRCELSAVLAHFEKITPESLRTRSISRYNKCESFINEMKYIAEQSVKRQRRS